MLLIHGARDRISPASMGERLLEACPLPAEQRVLWIVPDAKHLGTLKIAPDEYRRRVLGFLDAHFPQAKSA
jgi:pimeloyl-ACP methyl ester carboxylesterase